jgi:hypothetical protein
MKLVIVVPVLAGSTGRFGAAGVGSRAAENPTFNCAEALLGRRHAFVVCVRMGPDRALGGGGRGAPDMTAPLD